MVLNASNVSLLGNFRSMSTLSVANHGAEVWLRFPPVDIAMEQQLSILPAMFTYRENEDGLLFQKESITPIRKIPVLTWQTIEDFIPIELPTAALPAKHAPTYHLKIVPSSNYQVGSLLRLSLDVWRQYAETAPAIRMESLRFALSEDGEVLVMGVPLPALPGEEYWLHGKILLPSGYDFEWPIIAPLFAEKENLDNKALILMDKNCSWQKIELQNFVKATRMGIRRSNINYHE